jgi:quercetin dioxygenase-like cupin family protein
MNPGLTKCLVLVALIACLLSLPAQSLPEVEVTAEPAHHLIFANQYVRVFQVEVAPYAATLMHRHRHDYFYVTLGPAEISNQVPGNSPVTAKLQDGEVNFLPGNSAHTMRNLSGTPFRNLTIEFLQDEKAHNTSPPKWDEERGLHIFSGGTQDVMFVKDGVRVSELELQPGGVIPKHHHAGPHLVVAVSDLELSSQGAGKAVSQIQLKSGEVRWVPGGFTHTLTNTGHQEARFVTLEFH